MDELELSKDILKAREKAMKNSLKARLRLVIPLSLMPLLTVGLLTFFLPVYLASHEIKWILYAGLFTCAMIFLGYFMYKYKTRDL
ncbi:hypothetical protein [Paenibacillus sp. FSL L8-0708]|uniref:hypothetical protein n=1 Tax=Paenibacillus sp. FSL L8-0708 TaxID=2975311 RepID=UPI0030FC1B5F